MKFAGWEECSKLAAEVLIDEMKALLELHYDDVCYSAKRDNTRKLNISVGAARAYYQQLNQKLKLPSSVKDIFRSPTDELKWDRLKRLYVVIQEEWEGTTNIFLNTPDEIEHLAEAIEQCQSRKFADEVGRIADSKLREGMRLVTPFSDGEPTSSRGQVAAWVRGIKIGHHVMVKTRPFHTSREPPADKYSKNLMKSQSFETFVHDKSIEDVRDRFLLCLFDALFLSM